MAERHARDRAQRRGCAGMDEPPRAPQRVERSHDRRTAPRRSSISERIPPCASSFLSGRGKSFSAGADIDWMKRQGAAPPRQTNVADARGLAEMFRILATSPEAHHRARQRRGDGRRHGTGRGLRHRASHPSERNFAASEVRLGLIPRPSRPMFCAPSARARRGACFLTGERIDAAHAQRIGLVHETAEPDALDARLQALVEDLLAAGPAAQSARQEADRCRC